MNPRFVQNGTGEFQIGSREQGLARLRGYNAAEAALGPAPAAGQEAADQALLVRHVERPMVTVVGRPRLRGSKTIVARLRARVRTNVTFRIGRFRIARTVRGTPRVISIPVLAGNARKIRVRMFTGPNFIGEFQVARRGS